MKNDIELEVDCYLIEMRKLVRPSELENFDEMAEVLRQDVKKLRERLERSEYARFKSIERGEIQP